MTRQSCDVLIIGAGASGALAARYFAGAGMSVTCLEQGEWVRPADYPGAKPDWELQRRQRWHYSPNVRQLEADYPLEVTDAEVYPVMFNGVGGSTILWGAQWHRMKPSDFRVRTLDGVAADWPIDYETLAPYYDRVDHDVGVSGLAGDPAYPAQPAYPLPPLPIGVAGARMAAAMNQLGWHWWPGSNAIPSKSYGNLNPCARLGTCVGGCSEGAKASVDLVYWPAALKDGAVLVTGARVSEVLVNDNGLATGARYIDRGGETHVVDAAIVVMCANGVGTARLLLQSKSKRFPDGLANRSGLVGRGLMLHPLSAVIGVFPESVEGWLGPAGHMIQSMEFYETDASRGFVRGGKWSLMPTGGPMGAHPGLAGAPFETGWGAAGHAAVAATLGKSVLWSIINEDLPDDDNRIELDDALTDSDGLPAVKVTYRISRNTHDQAAFQIARATESMKAAGAVATIPVPIIKEAGGHLLGTTRMGIDAGASVVDSFGRSHDVPNLYVFDGGSFVTSSGVNPTATILANALRCTDAVIAARRDQRVAA
jgi:choline dehydrogenase-like flavoprotein